MIQKNNLYYLRIILICFSFLVSALTLSYLHISVERGLDEDLKEKALNSFKKHSSSIRNKKLIIIIDYDKDIFQKRFWLYDIQQQKVLLNNRVSHAFSSGLINCRNISNVAGSQKSCVGSFITGSQYQGKYGNSMKVIGLESQNDNAFRRHIVFHQNVAHKYYGFNIPKWMSIYSSGCFCLDKESMNNVINKTKNGTFIYVNKSKKESVSNKYSSSFF